MELREPKLYISGLGAVSPAGWTVPALLQALGLQQPLPAQPLNRPGWGQSLKVCAVPPPPERPPFLSHPRLRRASPLTHYAAAATLEAVAGLSSEVRQCGLGLIFCLQTGPVQYAARFLHEVIQDPATASPLLFPETVFSAPASHVAALLGQPPLVHTLLGDPGVLLKGVAMAAGWLAAGRVSACVVVGAEELNWVQADAIRHFNRAAVFSAGAAAVCLSLNPACSIGAAFAAITDPERVTAKRRQRDAAVAMRRQLGQAAPGELLCDGLGAAPRLCKAEADAWQDWAGPRLSPKGVLGEGLVAAGGWQIVAAAAKVAAGEYESAIISLVTCAQEAIGARLVRSVAGRQASAK